MASESFEPKTGLETVALLNQVVYLARASVDAGLHEDILDATLSIAVAVDAAGDEYSSEAIFEFAGASLSEEVVEMLGDTGEGDYKEDPAIEDEKVEEDEGQVLTNLLAVYDPGFTLGSVRSIYNKLSDLGLLYTHYYGENEHKVSWKLAPFIVKQASNGSIFWKKGFVDFLKEEFKKELDK